MLQQLKDLDKIVDKAKTMISLKEDDDDDNADADVSWIHQKVSQINCVLCTLNLCAC